MINSQIDVTRLQQFFRRTGWYSWLKEQEVRHMLRNAVYSAVAEEDDAVIGFVMIIGDGVVNTELDSLVVDREFRNRGVGTQLMKAAIHKIDELKPHFFQLKAKQSELEGFYSKFGFNVEEDQIVLSYEPVAENLRNKE